MVLLILLNVFAVASFTASGTTIMGETSEVRTEIVTPTETSDSIEAYKIVHLNKLFKLNLKEKAIVQETGFRIALVSFSGNYAQLLVISPEADDDNFNPDFYNPFFWIREGQTREAFGHEVTFEKKANGKGFFRITAEGETVKWVKLNKEFDLEVHQKARLVEEPRLNLEFNSVLVEEIMLNEGEEIYPMRNRAGIEVSYEAEGPNGTGTAVFFYLREGESQNAFGYRFTLNKLELPSSGGNWRAYLVIEKEDFPPVPPIKRVYLEKPFWLEAKEKALVVDGGMIIELNGIIIPSQCFSSGESESACYKPGPKASFRVWFTPVPTEPYEIETEEVIGVEEGSTEEEGETIIIPPMPYNQFTLGKGETVKVGGYTIKVLNISNDKVKFLVSKKFENKLNLSSLVNK
ncbi:MAG: hypothetical protein ABIE23_05550 [archaeon]